MKWKLAVALLVAVLSVPVAGLVASTGFTAGTALGPLLAILAGAFAAWTILHDPHTRPFFAQLKDLRPGDDLASAWSEIQTREKVKLLSRRTVSVERSGFGWVFIATRTLLSYAWRRRPVLTFIVLGTFVALLAMGLSGIPVLTSLAAAVSLFLFTASAFVVVTVMTEPSR